MKLTLKRNEGEIMSMLLQLKHSGLRGELSVPGDKSISHRAVIFASLAEGKTVIENFLLGEDCLRTLKAFQQMGVKIEINDKTVIVYGEGLHSLKEPSKPIDFGNSGTTARLMLGILAGQSFHSVLIGDDSLSKRPMDRVTIPLQSMGAKTDGRCGGKYLPMSIRGGNLSGITYTLPVNSAQVKSAILLAGLYANGSTTVIEPVSTRDHTERMIGAFGGKIQKNGSQITITSGQKLHSTSIKIPGDISSAAFFFVGAAITPGSSLTITNVGLNPTRTGIIDILQKMGANIVTEYTEKLGDEPVGKVQIEYSNLKGIQLSGEIIPRIIDEIPIVALAATQADGVTEIRDAKELRYKETDRIKAIVTVLSKLGADITELEDGIIIRGKSNLKGNVVSSYDDHRIGMMAAIASLITEGNVEMENPECINISYPTFFQDLSKLVNNANS
jgi:3-phosphoshikimate 1-carboxyvinyltransferase